MSVGRRCLVIGMGLVLAASCKRGASGTAPASTAYSDGFEVVVYDVDARGRVSNVRSLPLREAEKAIAGGGKALLPKDFSAVVQKLSTGKSGDSRVAITVGELQGGKQQVRVGFHESSRTFIYEYVVNGDMLTPIASEYRDLSRSNRVRYTNE